jgi:hypothetical protein
MLSLSGVTIAVYFNIIVKTNMFQYKIPKLLFSNAFYFYEDFNIMYILHAI